MENQNKKFDLEERTLKFAKDAREFIRKLPKTITNIEDTKQLARSSGSVGANYIEANEALGQKDFVMHIKISRKEAKESRYWLELINVGIDERLQEQRIGLAKEAMELMMIFSAIMRKQQ